MVKDRADDCEGKVEQNTLHRVDTKTPISFRQVRVLESDKKPPRLQISSQNSAI